MYSKVLLGLRSLVKSVDGSQKPAEQESGSIDTGDVDNPLLYIQQAEKRISVEVPRPERLIGRQGLKIQSFSKAFPRLRLAVAKKSSVDQRRVTIGYRNPSLMLQLIRHSIFREANEDRTTITVLTEDMKTEVPTANIIDYL